MRAAVWKSHVGRKWLGANRHGIVRLYATWVEAMAWALGDEHDVRCGCGVCPG